jgi:tRNA dimethylallyltransferase
VNQLLIISGPTATGKTDLAVSLAKRFNGELISADSRQIYKGMDIGTGKDHPKDIPLHLIDIINPNQSFSVAQYRRLAIEKINEVHSRGKLPILIGCSGFYIDSVINPNYSTFSIKPNFPLRSILHHLPTSLLQQILKIIDGYAFSNLNNSDLHNPIRLIRKIELNTYRCFHPSLLREGQGVSFDYLHLSLTAPNDFLYARIDKRVDNRLKLGHLDELNRLLTSNKWTNTGLQVSAYKSFKDYFNKKGTLAGSIQKWKYLEHRDARRQ